jgi:hypothetical protein
MRLHSFVIFVITLLYKSDNAAIQGTGMDAI